MTESPLQQLDPESKIWAFAAERELTEQQTRQVSEALQGFVDDWYRKGKRIPATFEMRDGRFILVGVSHEAELSGCSIDRLFKLLKKLEGETGASFLDTSRVYYRSADGAIRSMTRPELRSAVSRGEITPSTSVFNLGVETVEQYLQNGFEQPAAESWVGPMLQGA